MGCRSSSPIGKEALSADFDKDGKINKQDMLKFIDKNEHLYQMLAVSLNLPEEKCKQIATNVALQLAKKRPNQSLRDLSDDDKDRDPTTKEFQSFLDFVKDPKGEQEFFHRTIFAVYDTDMNGYIDLKELDKFLDVFYEAGSIFAGDSRLPPKQELKKLVLKSFDTNKDGQLQFSELRPLLSGARSLSSKDLTIEQPLEASVR